MSKILKYHLYYQETVVKYGNNDNWTGTDTDGFACLIERTRIYDNSEADSFETSDYLSTHPLQSEAR